MFTSENTTRKIDSLGRITLPKSLRDRMGYKENEELAFYTAEVDGKKYICLSSTKDDNKWAVAAQALLELGIEVPEELKEKIES